MSDWGRRSGSSGRRWWWIAGTSVVVIVAGVVVGLSALNGHDSSDPADPASGVAAQDISYPTGRSEDGVPTGYSQTETGARTAAVNAVIGGLWLRGSTNGTTMRVVTTPAAMSEPAVRLLLDEDPPACMSFDDGEVHCAPDNPQRGLWDFSPRGIPLSAQIDDEPTINGTGATVVVTVKWTETRGAAGRPATLATEFLIWMTWIEGDWKVARVEATENPSPTSPDSAWLGSVLTFVTEPKS